MTPSSVTKETRNLADDHSHIDKQLPKNLHDDSEEQVDITQISTTLLHKLFPMLKSFNENTIKDDASRTVSTRLPKTTHRTTTPKVSTGPTSPLIMRDVTANNIVTHGQSKTEGTVKKLDKLYPVVNQNLLAEANTSLKTMQENSQLEKSDQPLGIATEKCKYTTLFLKWLLF